jgi:hypothetical protein
MNVSINFELPAWLCYYVISSVYFFAFSFVMMLSFYWIYRCFNVYIMKRGIARRWRFYAMSKEKGNFDRCYLQPAMNEWLEQDKDIYFSAVWSSLAEHDVDFLVFAKHWYGEGYEKAMAEAEEQYAKENTK